MTTLETVINTIAEYKGLDAATINADSEFKDLGLDSLDMAELAMQMEDTLNITLELNPELTKVGDIVKLIDEAK